MNKNKKITHPLNLPHNLPLKKTQVDTTYKTHDKRLTQTVTYNN